MCFSLHGALNVIEDRGQRGVGWRAARALEHAVGVLWWVGVVPMVAEEVQVGDLDNLHPTRGSSAIGTAGAPQTCSAAQHYAVLSTSCLLGSETEKAVGASYLFR